EALHRPEPPPAWKIAGDLVALVLERGEHRDRVDADLLPDAEESREEALGVAIDEGARALEREVLELRELAGAEARYAALDVPHAVGVMARFIARDVRQQVLQQRLLGQVPHLP